MAGRCLTAAARFSRATYQRRRRPLSAAPLAELVERLRTPTLTYLRTENRSAIARLRELLTPEARALLILRLDRKLAWIDIAAIMVNDGSPKDEEALRHEAAVLRKRFERTKGRLHNMAEAAGLLKPRS